MPPLALHEEVYCLHHSLGFRLTGIGKNIASCSRIPQFLPVKCTLCARCACAVHKRPPRVDSECAKCTRIYPSCPQPFGY